MAFKIVYRRRIHKLPLHVNTVSSIKANITRLYPHIDPTFHLIYFHNLEPLEIINEDALIILLKLLQLPTMKLFIHEGQLQDIQQDDILFMEQSSIFGQSIINQSKHHQPLYESNYNNPYPNNNMYDFPKPIQQQIQPIIQFPQESYSYQVTQNSPVQSYQNQEFIWSLALKNTGLRTWPQTSQLKCQDGTFKGVSYPLPEAIPNQVIQINLKLKAPAKEETILANWCLFYIENAKEQVLQEPITLYLEIIKEIPQQCYKGTLILAKAQQVKKILSDKSINYLCKFIEKHRLYQWKVDDIINKIYDESIQEHKGYNYPNQ